MMKHKSTPDFQKANKCDGNIMQRSKRRIGNGYSTSHNHGIMYQSRMRYLKSRDGTYSGQSSSSKTRLSERGERSQLPFSSLLGAARTPCVAEKLLPPTELMTRERSLRRAYWKYHPPTVQVKRMNFLERKEDPVLVRKRDVIFARIKAAELASERLKREKESWKRVEQQRSGVGGNGDGIVIANNSSPESSFHEDFQDGSGIEPLVRSKMQGAGCQSSEDALGDFSGFVSDGCKRDPLSPTTFYGSGGGDINDDNNFGGSFAFLADWNKKTKPKGYRRPNRFTPMQKV